jgi:type IV pilus assembly protein PilY1
MKRDNNNSAWWVLLTTAALFIGAAPLHADDTEIYFSSARGDGAANIMILLDTSGSMGWCGAATSSCDDPTATRMSDLRRSFSSLIDSLGSNVRIGVGRMNGRDGGYVLHPVRGLDEPADLLIGGASIRTGNDDANQWGAGAGSTNLNIAQMYFPDGNQAGGRAGFIFREVSVPRHMRVKRAAMRVQAFENPANMLTMNVDYQLGVGLPDFGAVAIDSRTWSPGGVVTVSEPWVQNSIYDVDLTDVMKTIIADPAWCGNAEIALRFRNVDTSAVNNRRITTYNRGLDNENFPAPALEVEWEEDPDFAPLLPGAGYESSLSCQRDIGRGLFDLVNDADQRSGSVALGRTELRLESGAQGALYRFPEIPFDLRSSTTRPDVVHAAQLSFRGVRASNSGWTGSTYNSNGTITLRIGVVTPSQSGSIEATSNYISGRTVLATMDYETSRRSGATHFNRQHILDVTNLVRQAMAHPDWVPGQALMFRIQKVAGAGAHSIGAQEGGAANAASLLLNVSAANQGTLIPRVRDRLKQIVNALPASGSTPLGESYTEMTRYMHGMDLNYGLSGSTYLSSADSRTGSTYLSPITGAEQACSSNHIVLMTDGKPQYDGDSNVDTQAITGVTLSGALPATASDRQQLCAQSALTDNLLAQSNAASWFNHSDKPFACMEELAAWNVDSERNTTGRRVFTHFIGFHLDSDTNTLAAGVSSEGQGMRVAADSAEELADAFVNIVNSITQSNATLAAPGVAVNQMNRLQHLDQLYFSVFKPSTNTAWQGNMKRYRLGGTAESPRIVDSLGRTAVDPATGFFNDVSRSWWGTTDDGYDVSRGGALAVLPQTPRKLLVSTSSPGYGISPLSTTVSTTALTHFELFDSLSATMLGLEEDASETARQDHLNYLLTRWGDPLHSVPRLVNYGYSGTLSEAMSDPDTQDNVVFVSTNHGALHAIDAKTGKEHFTFMPADELAKTALRVSNPPTDPETRKRFSYGLDSSWVFWRRADLDNPGTISRMFAYGGKRRGGDAYYALDVTDYSDPKMLWQIDRSESGPFSRLGQTWSEPALAQIRVGEQSVPVLVFGGGYSAIDHDPRTHVSSGDARGNAIYIVNATTGALIWWGAPGAYAIDGAGATTVGSMKWSIAANVTPVDINFNGYIDHIYAVDLGGQVFRVDLNRASSGTHDLVQRVERIGAFGAEAAGVSSMLQHRRFFNAPTVAVADRGGNRVLQVAVGSGYRAGPLSEDTQDRMYVLDDVGVVMANSPGYETFAASVYPLGHADLVDVTTNLTPEASLFNGKYGWYISLQRNRGEKVLARAAIVQGELLFTTFTNDINDDQDVCNAVAGGARLYRVNLNNGSPLPLNPLNNDGTLSRFTDLNVPGIPPEPQVLIGGIARPAPGDDEDDEPVAEGACGYESALTAIIGTEVANLGELRGCGFRKTRWYETDRSEAEAIVDAEGARR